MSASGTSLDRQASPSTPAPSRRLNVALIIPSLMVGGAEQHVVKLARSIDPAEIRLTILLLRPDLPHPLRAGLPAGVKVEIASVHRRDPRLALWVGQKLRAGRIAVAHSFLWHADATAALARPFAPRTALVTSERGERSQPYHGRRRRLFDRAITFPSSRAICPNSEFGRALLTALGAPPSRLEVIPNGADAAAALAARPAAIRASTGWPAAAHIVGSVSRLADGKGVEVLVRAIAEARESADVRALIVGDGPRRGALEALAAELGVGDRVVFSGEQTDPLPLVLACDSAVQLSRDSEHCSNAILEAMACAKPVVATRTGGNVELVVDGVTGMLVPPQDPAAVARALVALARDGDAARRLGEAGRARAAREFDLPAIARRHAALWRRVAGTPTVRGVE